jgi:predicted RNA-binding Zn-ribbon protein involved in translation (DUF1610 family)
VSDGLPKKQPAELACPRCGESIVWRPCSQCGGLGEWQFIASSHCGVPQQGKFCSECGATLPAWEESCAFCAGRGWLATEHACSAADQPPPGRPFRVDPATRPVPVPANAVEATTFPVVTSAPPASQAAVPAPVVAATTASASAPSAATAVNAPPQPVPGSAAPEPKRSNRMNLWIAILFLAIFALLIASPELTDTIRRSFQAVFVR